MSDKSEQVLTERRRIQEEYQRREREIDKNFYAPWQPYEMFMQTSRRRMATRMLHQANVFPGLNSHCMEIGYGRLGWLGDLIAWGVPEKNLHGIELDRERAQVAQTILPHADLRIGDATELPWKEEAFQLVIASTVFTSILDLQVRKILAQEIVRVIAPGGALLWYDFAVNNPKNRNVLRVGKKDLTTLFPALIGNIRRVTLAPPLARVIAGKSWLMATILETIPLLRTHLLAILVKG